MSLLEARSLDAGYAGVAVVRGLDLHVDEGEIVALFGPNGAGKSTTIMTLCGALPVIGGEVRLGGVATTASLHVRARSGVGLVTEQRSVFARMTVADNLKVSRCRTDVALEYFPELEQHLARPAGLLSGGQQQMLALARALTRGEPKVLLIDEISLGLAPQVVDRLLGVVTTAAARGAAIILVEQYVHKATDIADRIYVMRRGRIHLTGGAEDFRGDVSRIEEAYLSADPSPQEPGAPTPQGKMP
ncbi:ABC transporter ATP-binding protein [Amycolatopsis pigmentata]|uniref:ABC transporter ATP-binding protein n=1 Tax=Amycolatopsis pigmentata TaxID=450801 RepID=A0ABW5FKV7_9PSEU